jgi:hypothetical protein
MVTVIKKGATKKTITSKLNKLGKKSVKKGLDAHRYAGTVKFKEDGLALQKQWRNEW